MDQQPFGANEHLAMARRALEASLDLITASRIGISESAEFIAMSRERIAESRHTLAEMARAASWPATTELTTS